MDVSRRAVPAVIDLHRDLSTNPAAFPSAASTVEAGMFCSPAAPNPVNYSALERRVHIALYLGLGERPVVDPHLINHAGQLVHISAELADV